VLPNRQHKGHAKANRPEVKLLKHPVKSRFTVQGREPSQLLETLKWDPEAGFVLLSAHLFRLESSAQFFNFRFDRRLTLARLEAAVQNVARVPMKLRLRLSASGDLTTDVVPLDADPLPGRAPVRFAHAPVERAEPTLFHKTTNREPYRRLLDAAPGCYDVLLWNQDAFVTELTRFNVLAYGEGQWKTPPVEHGLLRGTLREELLRVRLVAEAGLTKHDLRNAPAVAVTNSVRGLLRLKPQTEEEGWLLEPFAESAKSDVAFRPLIDHVQRVMKWKCCKDLVQA
jgi:para-aminobenzoate synthetase/4-amino-4-deoxychorismate lyase